MATRSHRASLANEDCGGPAVAEPQRLGTDLIGEIVFVGSDVHKATVAVVVTEGALIGSR